MAHLHDECIAYAAGIEHHRCEFRLMRVRQRYFVLRRRHMIFRRVIFVSENASADTMRENMMMMM